MSLSPNYEIDDPKELREHLKQFSSSRFESKSYGYESLRYVHDDLKECMRKANRNFLTAFEEIGDLQKGSNSIKKDINYLYMGYKILYQNIELVFDNCRIMCTINEKINSDLKERIIELEKQSHNKDKKTKVSKISKSNAGKIQKKLTKRQIAKLKNSCTEK